MDFWQDELTDRVVGDLIEANSLIKIADNIYFGGNDVSDLHTTFEEIIKRIAHSDLRAKPSKIKLNIVAADILGLHWTQGSLTPSRHKLDPLACCSPPVTVSGLRGWLGGVRFNQVCLPGAKLAFYTQKLDKQIPSSREPPVTLANKELSLDDIIKATDENPIHSSCSYSSIPAIVL